MNLFLIGMMGSGKSYWTHKLSEHTGMPGYDLDELIVASEGLSIAEIFTSKGEAHFRKAEAAILRRFAYKDSFILATGGGTPCFEGNMQWMNQHGVTIWLDEPVELLAQRLQAEKSHRPLISPLSDSELVTFLQKKLTERKPFYQLANYRLVARDLTNFEKIIAE